MYWQQMSSVAPPEDVLSHGVLGGQVVGNDAANDLQLVQFVEQKLIQRMRRSIDAIDPASFKSGGERSKVSATPFRRGRSVEHCTIHPKAILEWGTYVALLCRLMRIQ
jgi:hypothetical protein